MCVFFFFFFFFFVVFVLFCFFVFFFFAGRGLLFFVLHAYMYSKTSMTRTPLAQLLWLIRTRFESGNSSDSSRKQKFWIF